MAVSYLVSEILFRTLLFLLFLYTEFLPTPHHMEILPDLSKSYSYNSNRDHQLLPTHILFPAVCIIPMLVFLIVNAIKGSMGINVDEVLALTGVFVLNGVITNTLKLTIGRPRPDFLSRCAPVSPRWDTGPECTGDRFAVDEGYKSFPSGHSTWSFCTLFFITLYLAGKFNVISQFRVRFVLLILSLFPFLVGCCIGWSRVHDHMHHFEDVLAGATIGCIISSLCYFQYFPSLLSQNSHRTISELRDVDLS